MLGFARVSEENTGNSRNCQMGLANRWFQPLTHVSGSQRRARAIAAGLGSGKGAMRAFRDSLGRKCDSPHRRSVAGDSAWIVYGVQGSVWWRADLGSGRDKCLHGS